VPVLVAGDPTILEVALRNLVENALQYSPPGAPVTVRVAGDGSIEVGDAGPGIAPELRAQIFEPFWSGNPDHGGAGLGLTIVRRVAERYGGEVSVEDAPGGGTIVALRFPIAAADAAGSELAAARTSIPASLALRRRAMALDRAID
jgi:two-component system sensor histidine kinase QseC